MNSSRKPTLRFKGFYGEWEEKKLGEVAEYSKGNGYSKSDLTNNGTPIIMYGRLYTNYQFLINDVDTFVVPRNNSVYSQGNEVIVPASGETPEDIARASAIEKSGIILGGDLNIIRPFNFITPMFLSLTISNGKSKTELSKKAQGKSIVHLHNTDIQELVISCPTTPEQEKIGAFFRQLDSLISLHQTKYDKLINIKKSLLEKMFPQHGNSTPALRFKGFSDEWEEKKLGEVITRIGTGLNPRDNFILNSGGNNYYVTIKNFIHGHLFLDDDCDKIDDNALQKIQERSDLQVDDILFTSIGRIGDCYLIKESPKNWNINESVFTLRPNQKLVIPEYIFHTIHSDIILKQILNDITGSTFKSIKIGDLRQTEIPFPSKAEQHLIASFITNFDHMLSLTEQKLEMLKNIKKACLEKMFV